MSTKIATHALITGASSGLGAAMATRLAAGGVALTLLGRNEQRLDKVAADCRARGVTVAVARCDVRDGAAMHAALEAADDNRPLDLVIANAGVGGAAVLAGSDGEPAELAREVVATNVIGAINTLAPLQRRFVARRRGRLVIIGSIAGHEGLADAPSYAASKAAVRIYAHGLRRLLAPHGVKVCVVTPGFVETPMSRSLPFVQPFCWSADRAAERILRGLHRNEREITFPWQLGAAAAIAGVLPARLVDRMLSGTRRRLKPRS